MKRFILVAFLACCCLGLSAAPPARATDNPDWVKELKNLAEKVDSQRRLLERQAAEIEALKAKLAAPPPLAAQPAPGKAAAGGDKKPALAKRFNMSTDLRLRHEGLYDRKQSGAGLEDRDRFRMRWRVFGDYRVNDELSMHSMLTTSSGSWLDSGGNSRNWQPGRTSNQTFDDEFNNKGLYIGRIYAQYQPKRLPGLELGAGKFKNSFLHTDIMWDPDVNPEGAYERYQYKGWKNFQPFVHLGQMVVAENNKADDAYLLVWQAGAVVKTGGLKWTLAGSYYHWVNPEKSDLSKIEGSAAGNSVDKNGQYLYDYRLVEGLAFLEFRLAKLPVKLWLDWIMNTADGLPGGRDTAFSTGFVLGKAAKKHDWDFMFKYAEIEPDAVVGAVNDGDFYGTNRRGYKAQLRYRVLDPCLIAVSWFQTESMVGGETSENRLQTDFILDFSLF